MLYALQDYLQSNGYRGVAYTGGVTFYKAFADELLVVQLVSQETIALLDGEKILKHRFDFEELLRSNQDIPVPMNFLTVVVIKDEPSDYFKQLANDVRGFVMVSEKSRRVIVYENQRSDYYGLIDGMNAYINSGVIDAKKRAEKELIKSALQPVTIGLIVLNILVYLYSVTHGNVMDATYMFSIGAITWDSIIQDHQYLRLITAAFLHYGIKHLSSNMLSLFGLGLMLEKRIGHFWFFVLYIVSMIAANVVSVMTSYWQEIYMHADGYSVSAGASGAVFGVVGGLIAFAITQKRWSVKKSDFVGIDFRSIMFMAFFSLLAGFTTTGVDNAAHVGGLIFGFIIVLLLAIRK